MEKLGKENNQTMKIMIKKLNLLICLFVPILTFGRVHEYETSRLKSTAGAGAGSILLDEANFLNPASLAFFRISAAYAQRYGTSYLDSAETASTAKGISAASYQEKWEESRSYGFVVSDTRSPLKGSFSYVMQREGPYERKRPAVSVGHAVSKRSSLGMTFRYTDDFNQMTGEKNKYKQMNVGVTHILNKNFTTGLIVSDVLKSQEEDTRLTLGIQLMAYDILTFIGDIGFNYYDQMSQTYFYKVALQVNFLSDLYLRGGLFRDNFLEEKGEGVGLSWISPKLVFDLALKTTKPINSGAFYPFRELSFSISYRF